MKRVLCTGASGFIGTHLIDHLAGLADICVLNLDIAKPKLPRHCNVWQQGDILDLNGTLKIFSKFNPTHVIHLAAKADMEGKTLADYRENVEGTRNILQAVKATPSIDRIVVVSSQHVKKPGSTLPRDDEDFDPYEAYGESKVVTEQLTRTVDIQCTWTIVRPTGVWGPGHVGLANGLWRTIASGLYMHPRNDRVIRGYGYVKNVIFQLISILELPKEVVDRKVFYLGDDCVQQKYWVDAFAKALTGTAARKVPRSLLYAIALAGEAASFMGLPAPLYLARYKNMITTNPVPMKQSLAVLGHGPYSLEDGIQETMQWLKDEKIVKEARGIERANS